MVKKKPIPDQLGWAAYKYTVLYKLTMSLIYNKYVWIFMLFFSIVFWPFVLAILAIALVVLFIAGMVRLLNRLFKTELKEAEEEKLTDEDLFEQSL